jgi:hypothetical protein
MSGQDGEGHRFIQGRPKAGAELGIKTVTWFSPRRSEKLSNAAEFLPDRRPQKSPDQISLAGLGNRAISIWFRWKRRDRYPLDAPSPNGDRPAAFRHAIASLPRNVCRRRCVNRTDFAYQVRE